jgi:hypothetical protein
LKLLEKGLKFGILPVEIGIDHVVFLWVLDFENFAA